MEKKLATSLKVGDRMKVWPLDKNEISIIKSIARNHGTRRALTITFEDGLIRIFNTYDLLDVFD